MKTTIEEKKYNLDSIINKPTPRLDKIASDFYKIVSATAAKFIPDACRALMQDWQIGYDTLTNPRYKALRDEMRERILDRFSKDREPRAIWADEQVKQYFIEEFRNPIQLESTKGALEKARAASARKYQEKIKAKTIIFDKLAKDLPEPPKPEPKGLGEDPKVIRVIDEPMFMKVGEKGKSILTRFGEIYGPAQDFIEGMTGQRVIPHGLDEKQRLDEYIKPSREDFMTVYHEVDERMKAGLYNALVYIAEIVEDRIELVDKVRR